MAIVQAFTDVQEVPLPVATGDIYGTSDLTNTAQIGMGFGSKVFRADEQGIWLGAKKFADAPFSVDMEGNTVASSLTISGYLTNAGSNQALSGSILVGTGSGGSSVLIDGANNRIVVHDGTTNRIVIGNV